MASVAPDVAADVAPVPGSSMVSATCRNCGAAASGEYCPSCGQETRLALPTARQFLREAAGRYVALDGRLWRTLATLAFRPGHLTRVYLAGQRRRYIRPARLFLVLSLLMFAVIRISVDVPRIVDTGIDRAEDRTEGKSSGVEADTPAAQMPGLRIQFGDDGVLSLDGTGGPFGDEIRRRVARFNAMSRQEKAEQVYYGVIRYGPYASFVLLPAYALLLRVAYAGRARRYPDRPHLYAQHLVHAAHTHAFFFIAVALAVALPLPGIGVLLSAWGLVYALWSQKAVYGGRWLGVLARAWLVGIAYFVLFAFATVGLVLVAVFVR